MEAWHNLQDDREDTVGQLIHGNRAALANEKKVRRSRVGVDLRSEHFLVETKLSMRRYKVWINRKKLRELTKM